MANANYTAEIRGKRASVAQVEKTATLLMGKIDEAGGGEASWDGTGIEDAPSDGKVYARSDEAWAVVNKNETLNGIEEAPNDGKVYVRTEESWQEVNPSVETVNVGIDDAPDDGNAYVRQSGEWVKVETLNVEEA